MRDPAPQPWHIVGIGDDGLAGLGVAERALVTGANTVIGGQRHLAMLDTQVPQRHVAWPRPLRAGISELLASCDPAETVILASGDPLRSGIASTLIEVLGPGSVTVHPHLSSATLARSRQGWPAETTHIVTLVGRARDASRIRAQLYPGARLILLSTGAQTVTEVAELLCADGWQDATMTVRWHLGGAQEGSLALTAAGWAAHREAVPDLNVICLELPKIPAQPHHSRTPGLPDECFDNDGQLTKRELRAAALAHLRPSPGELLWDLGAGAGSIGIEWARAAPGAQVVAVERQAPRAARIAENARSLGAPEVTVRCGTADALLAELPDPDAVFIGGGFSLELVQQCWSRLSPGGRLVAHAVTVETEVDLVGCQQRYGGQLTRIAVERALPLGRYLSWRPGRAVTQWSVTKP